MDSTTTSADLPRIQDDLRTGETVLQPVQVEPHDGVARAIERQSFEVFEGAWGLPTQQLATDPKPIEGLPYTPPSPCFSDENVVRESGDRILCAGAYAG